MNIEFMNGNIPMSEQTNKNDIWSFFERTKMFLSKLCLFSIALLKFQTNLEFYYILMILKHPVQYDHYE